MCKFTDFTYQHTCKKGHVAYILKRTPFPSKITERNGRKSIPFLGEGFYFWEENTIAAHRWGKNHYNDNYSITEYEKLKINESEILDFLNRTHTRYFNELRKDYIELKPNSKNWSLGVWIEFFKTLNKNQEITFNYNFIRAEENLPNSNENNYLKRKILFKDGLQYYTFLDPLLVLCVIDKSNLVYTNKVVLN